MVSRYEESLIRKALQHPDLAILDVARFHQRHKEFLLELWKAIPEADMTTSAAEAIIPDRRWQSRLAQATAHPSTR